MFPKFMKPIEVHTVHELGLGAIFALFFWPIGFVVYCFNVSLRLLAQLILNFYHPGRYAIADGEDSVFGVKLRGSSKSYIHGFKIIKGKPDINVIRMKMLEIFRKTDGYERLKYVMVPKYNYFFWDTKVPFDVTRHIRLLDDFDPNEVVDEAKLTKICSDFVGTVVGKDDMPQWEFLMIPRFRTAEDPEDSTETSHYALIVRLHHAYCDGISYVLLINNFLSDVPGELPIDPRKGFDTPIWIKAYIWAKILVIGPLNFFKNLAILLLASSEYRVERYVTSKVLARSSPVEMEKLKAIRLASGTSTTAITITAVYSALYKTHLRIFPGKPVPSKLQLGSIGVMLPYAEEKHLVNQFTMCRYAGLLEVHDPKERLEKTFEEIRKSASQPDPIFNFFMQRALGSLPVFLHEILFNLSGTPIMLSNVPGYKTSVKAFGGEIVDLAAWIPLVTTTGIGLSSQSYCGRMNFSAVCDPQIFPNATEATKFLEEIVHQIDILAQAYGIHQSKVGQEENVAGSIENCEGQRSSHYDSRIKIEIKDTNHNDESVPVVSSQLNASSAFITPLPPQSTSLNENSMDPTITKDKQCRNRKEDLKVVVEGKDESSTVKGTSFEKKIEKVI